MRVIAWPAFSTKAVNPYTDLLYRNMSALGVDVREFSASELLRNRWDIFHVHWPDYHVGHASPFEVLVRITRFLALVALVRRKGTRVVWTAHNVQSHERRHPVLEKLLWRAFTAQTDGVISLSHSARRIVVASHKSLTSVPTAVIPHGHYRDVYPPAISRSDARNLLGLEAVQTVIGFVGTLRRYKRVPELVRAFQALGDDSARLLIGGYRPADLNRDELTGPNVLLHDRFLPDAELPAFFAASDLIVLPYSDVLNSGSALLALSFDRPVLLPSKGAMAELQSLVGSDWIRLFDGELTPEVLRDALAWARCSRRSARPDLTHLDWQRIASSTIGFYKSILSSDASQVRR